MYIEEFAADHPDLDVQSSVYIYVKEFVAVHPESNTG